MKLLSPFLVIAMVLSMVAGLVVVSSPQDVSAADPTTLSVTIETPPVDVTYSTCQNFAVTATVRNTGDQIAFNVTATIIVDDVMVEMAPGFPETVNLGHWTGKAIAHLDKIDSREILRIDSGLGTRAPAYCTGLGKSILAFLPMDERDEYLENVVFEALTPNTFTSVDALMEELVKPLMSEDPRAQVGFVPLKPGNNLVLTRTEVSARIGAATSIRSVLIPRPVDDDTGPLLRARPTREDP